MWISNPDTRLSTRNSGFTLLEVMVAVAMLAIVLTAVYRLYVQTISMTAAVRFYAIAPLLAKGKADTVGLEEKTNIGSESGDFGEGLPGYAWRMTVEDIESEYLGEFADAFKRIDVTVILNDDYTYSLRTYRLLPDRP